MTNDIPDVFEHACLTIDMALYYADSKINQDEILKKAIVDVLAPPFPRSELVILHQYLDQLLSADVPAIALAKAWNKASLRLRQFYPTEETKDEYRKFVEVFEQLRTKVEEKLQQNN